MSDSTVAIVHDYLNQRGGAERVVLEMSDMWPGAPIYTSLYRPDSTWPGFAGRDVRTSFLDRLPVDRGFRGLLPLYPAAFRSFGEIDAEVVLSSSSGWAHMVRTHPRAMHMVYCHTPARWLYGGEHIGLGPRRQRLAKSGFAALRRLDRVAARRADYYIANSNVVRSRVKRAYGIDAPVVPPPVDVDRFRPTPRGDRLLVVSRLLPYKHVDLVVQAATRSGVGLDVVGDGPLLAGLRELAGPTVTLHGVVDDRAVVELMESCRAVCVAAEEDFGLVAVEAQAAGKPVIAYGRGGVLETIDEGLTGVLFREHTVEAVIEAIAECEGLEASPEAIAAHVRRFSRPAFHARLHAHIDDALGRGGETGPGENAAKVESQRGGPRRLRANREVDTRWRVSAYE